MSLGQSLQKYTYQYLLEKALSQVPDDIDKREGSIIFDALAPACYVLAEYFMEVHRLSQEISIETASGEWLDNKALEVGITRNTATPAVKVLELKTLRTVTGSQGNNVVEEVPVTEDLAGKRFSTVSMSQPLYYVIKDFHRDENTNPIPGAYRVECETVGVVGNEYTGTVIPLDFMSELSSAMLTGTIISGMDNESDEDLRQRYLDRVRYRSFGGNVAQYREMALGLVIEDQLAGIGGVQVYPTWDKTESNPNGAGTVKLSVISPELLPFSDEQIALIQAEIDPQENSGQGLGIAPIGHRVTVVTPQSVVVDIYANVSLGAKTLEQAKVGIVEAVQKYFEQLREDWDKGNDVNEYSSVIYQSQIVRAALGVDGVMDFSDVVMKKQGLNQAFVNIPLTQTGVLQELPELGEVYLNAV